MTPYLISDTIGFTVPFLFGSGSLEAIDIEGNVKGMAVALPFPEIPTVSPTAAGFLALVLAGLGFALLRRQ